MEVKITRHNQSERINRFSHKQFSTRLAKLPPRVIMFITFAGMSIINYGFGLAAGWLLVPGDFGLLAFVQTVLTITGLVLNSGFAWSLTAALVGASETDRAGLVRGALISNLLLALVMNILILLFYILGPLKPGLESWPVTVLVMGTLPLLSFIAIARATVQGSERFGALATLWLLETGTKAVAGIGLVKAGYGAIGAIAGFFIGSLVAALIGLWYLVVVLKILPFGSILRTAFNKAGAMFGAILGMALLLNLDMVALKLFSQADRAAVGRYQAGTILANTPYYLLTATIPVIFTQISGLKKISQSASIVGETFQLALIVLLPLEGLLALFPELFLRLLFPLSYLAGASTLRILALGNASIILVAILSTAFQATGNASIPGRAILAITFCEAICLKVIIPGWHSLGAASVFLTATSMTGLVLGACYLQNLNKTRLQKAIDWLKRYGISIGLGFISGWITLTFIKNSWFAMGIGGSLYLIAIYWLKLFPLSSFIRQTAASPVPVVKEE